MNRSISRFPALALVLCLLVGCASSNQGVDRSSKASDGIGVVKNEINKVIAQVDATNAALNDLVNNPKSDLKPQYNNYVKQVNNLDSLAKKVASRNQSMKAKTADYFQNWEKESGTIKSESIRQISAERRAAARASFDKMTAEVAKGKAAFTPLMDELHDIELYLSNDLTTAGVAACKPVAAEANANAAKVKESLNNVIADLTRVQTELSPEQSSK
jgi:uncharacterized protein YcfL